MVHSQGILSPLLARLILDPELALTLVVAGVLLLYVEFNRPGRVIFAALGIFFGTLGGFALLQHPIDAIAVLVLPLGIGLSILGLNLRHGHLLEALSMLTLTWALHRLLPGDPGISIQGAFIASAAFVVCTTWLGGIALQARRNKRLPVAGVQSSIPNQHPATPARRVD